MASLSSLLWWWHRQSRHGLPKRGKLQGGLLELHALAQSLLLLWCFRGTFPCLSCRSRQCESLMLLLIFLVELWRELVPQQRGRWAELRCLTEHCWGISAALNHPVQLLWALHLQQDLGCAPGELRVRVQGFTALVRSCCSPAATYLPV